MATFTPTVRKVVNGNDVIASVVNAGLDDLDQRTLNLRDQIRSIQSAYRVVNLTEMPVADDVTSWSAVYWNPSVVHSLSVGALSPAIGGVDWSGSEFILHPTNYVMGVVGEVTGTVGQKTATLYIQGLIQLAATSGLLQTGQTLTAGIPAYLTNNTTYKGKLVLTRPYIEVIVGVFVPTGFVVSPYVRNLGETHLHYRYDLSDHTQWSVIPGGYLYPAALLDPYPPIPFESAVLIVNGLEYKYGSTLDYFLDSDGVHYLNSTYPPAATNFSVTLYYLIPKGVSDVGVASLQPDNDVIQIRNCSVGGSPDTGNLLISAVNVVEETTTASDRTLTIKKLISNSTNGHLEAEMGPYVQRLVAGAGVSVSPSTGYGNVTVSVVEASQIRRTITDIALQNAKERILGMTSYIGFPKTVVTEILCKFKLPPEVDSSFVVDIYADYLGSTSSATYTYGTFNVAYRVIPTGSLVTTAGLTTGAALDYSAGYVYNTTASKKLFTIPGTQLTSGGVVSFKLTRDIMDTYAGELGLVILEYVLNAS